ncbi:MAG: NAD(P)H-quinone oxidoreductase [Propionibacteriaceae bacterium]|jgi:putative PIG3 family NAD(P)H quinone oxidoreductase|nr:NAD(P)H-quinone oxidoreductase [Propionibacteriaceae bacterium]
MRAVTTTGPGGIDVLQVSEVPTPEVEPGQLRIRVQAAGVNRADIVQRRGFYPPPPGISDIIGLEVAGTVDAVGAGVTGWRVGDPTVAIVAGGGYAEYVVAPAGQCAPLPPGVGLVAAAGVIEVAATVVSNFDAVGLAAGQTCLIHGGAGGIGSFAIPYAKALGAQVITTVGSAEKADYCRQIGADVAVDYHTDWPAAIAQATSGRGCDVILDIIGAKYLEANVASLARGGRLVIIGLQGGRKATLDINQLLTRNGLVTATSLRFRPVAEKAAIVQSVVEQVWPLFGDGRLTVPPQRYFPLEQVAEAHTWLESGENIGKVVLTLSEPAGLAQGG